MSNGFNEKQILHFVKQIFVLLFFVLKNSFRPANPRKGLGIRAEKHPRRGGKTLFFCDYFAKNAPSPLH